ncbi:UMP kinase [Acetobacterium wieringae]|jgi:uridylate kinase|uniref:Uridylate kinase n=1 Tax=Acetobacterium wieringae TaxID=52694 RepID=A0A5D0WSN3_9FIRM|nr:MULTISPECIES: UMP kinase [Acetobacterium]MEA4804827.1 UMP kinase [Acetobacterium wieringae]OXS26219.1 MAG: UMP kinase [Acetobacterium sp. MES1]TYC87147.1 UMP kinase [Acetobacterium wieringae]URN86080.1 UMP kinase [Acetobacterium wieringae]UYO64603.1 UMP kinase [Acetobacterium wieringae]
MKGGVLLEPKYKRVIIKLSGEALAGTTSHGIDTPTVQAICSQIKEVFELGVEIAIVVGGGNFWRGRSGEGMDKSTADYMGMLATCINALGLQDVLEEMDVPVRVQTAIEMKQIAEPYIRRKAVRHLEKRRVVIFACGTGNPFFTTDTTAALRAAEIDAEIILLAKSIDAVYDSDPLVNPDAVRYSELSYIDVLNQGLKVMDSTATSLCMDNHIPILVFGLNEPKNILRAIMGEKIGTIIQEV